jgi:GDPmannose 4,6-dehydratase
MNKQKVATVTGVNGQDGSFMANLLLHKGYKVYGAIRYKTRQDNSWIKEYGLSDMEIVYADLADSNSLNKLVSQTKPDEFYNFAAQSHVGKSFELSDYTMDVTGSGVGRLLEAIRLYSPNSKFVQASSSEMFGDAPAPQNEATPFSPRSPYAVAKAMGHYAVKVYRETYNLHASSAISFNHEGIRRSPDFVTRKITEYIGRLINGIVKEPLLLGNLDAQRDWSSATDIVLGIWLMAQQTKPDDYVLASGHTHSVREFASAAFAAAGIPIEWHGQGLDEYAVLVGTSYEVIRIDAKLYRPCEVPLLLGDASKAHQELGWRTTMPFDALVKWMVSHDIDRFSHDNTAIKANH